MKPRQFTKEDPCTKVHIYNCFHSDTDVMDWDGGLKSTNITRAKAIIGINVPRRLVYDGHAEMINVGGQQHIKLTVEGMNWLIHGVKRYLKNQPEKAKDIEQLPRHWRRRFLQTVAI